MRRGAAGGREGVRPAPIRTRLWRQPADAARRALSAGRLEFSYLPGNTQGAIIQPIGSTGVVVLGTDTQRGFTRLDQVGAGSCLHALRRGLSGGDASRGGRAAAD